MTEAPPTAAQIRNAFRRAVDAARLPPDSRRIALETFKLNLRADVPKRRTRRQEQNQGIRDALTLEEMMPVLVKEVIHVIKRNDWSSGERLHKANELGEMHGTPQPHYGDPTGEEACWDEKGDATGISISEICDLLSHALDSAKNLHELSNADVRVRAKKTMPDCLACGDQCIERVRRGLDNKCYTRFIREGRPDIIEFIVRVQQERKGNVDGEKGD